MACVFSLHSVSELFSRFEHSWCNEWFQRSWPQMTALSWRHDRIRNRSQIAKMVKPITCSYVKIWWKNIICRDNILSHADDVMTFETSFYLRSIVFEIQLVNDNFWSTQKLEISTNLYNSYTNFVQKVCALWGQTDYQRMNSSQTNEISLKPYSYQRWVKFFR